MCVPMRHGTGALTSGVLRAPCICVYLMQSLVCRTCNVKRQCHIMCKHDTHVQDVYNARHTEESSETGVVRLCASPWPRAVWSNKFSLSQHHAQHSVDDRAHSLTLPFNNRYAT